MTALRSIVILEGRFDEHAFTCHNVLDILKQAVQQGGLSFTEELYLQLTYRLRFGVLKVLSRSIVVRELLVDAGYKLGITDQLARHGILLYDPIEVLVSEVDVKEVQSNRKT